MATAPRYYGIGTYGTGRYSAAAVGTSLFVVGGATSLHFALKGSTQRIVTAQGAPTTLSFSVQAKPTAIVASLRVASSLTFSAAAKPTRLRTAKGRTTITLSLMGEPMLSWSQLPPCEVGVWQQDRPDWVERIG